MNPVFKYNSHAKYVTRDLKGRYDSNNFLLLNIYLKKGHMLKHKDYQKSFRIMTLYQNQIFSGRL